MVIPLVGVPENSDYIDILDVHDVNHQNNRHKYVNTFFLNKKHYNVYFSTEFQWLMLYLMVYDPHGEGEKFWIFFGIYLKQIMIINHLIKNQLINVNVLVLFIQKNGICPIYMYLCTGQS